MTAGELGTTRERSQQVSGVAASMNEYPHHMEAKK
jgi:hypothetical protein